MGERADERAVRLGLAATRSRAAALIRDGKLAAGGEVVKKPAARIADDVSLSLIGEDPDYASRGALKLIHGLDHFGIDVSGSVVLDLGASTGGFTDLLLRRGAKHVFAVDVGHGQLLPRLKADPRVTVLEGVDARRLDPTIIDAPVDLVTADLAFISLTKALAPALDLVRPDGTLLALVKPQFELERKGIGKGGIVRDATLRKQAVDSVAAWIAGRPDWKVGGTCESPIAGGGGNIEFLLRAIHERD